MPYDDENGRLVKRVVGSINRRFIAATDILGSTNAVNYKNPAVEPQGDKLLGRGRAIGAGQGCAQWTAASANKHYTKSKDRSEMSGGAILGLQDGTIAGDKTKPMDSQTHYENESKENNKFGSLGDALNSRLDANPLGPVAANARSGYAKKDDSPLESQSSEKAAKMGFGKRKSKKVLEGNGILSDTWENVKDGVKAVGSVAKPLLHMVPHPYAKLAAEGLEALGMGKSGGQSGECSCPRLKSGKAPKRCKCGAGKMSGGSGFAAGTHMDIGSGPTDGISSHGKTTGAGKPRGRPRKTGGAVLGLVKAPVSGPLDNSPAAYGNVKKTVKSTSKKVLDKPTTKADMPSSTLSGLGKGTKVGGKRSERAEIVKKVMKDRGISLMAASSAVKKEGLYKA
jgi:hypothetical protein